MSKFMFFFCDGMAKAMGGDDGVAQGQDVGYGAYSSAAVNWRWRWREREREREWRGYKSQASSYAHGRTGGSEGEV